MTKAVMCLVVTVSVILLLNFCGANIKPAGSQPLRQGMKAYRIITAKELKTLEEKVNEKIGGDWHLVGSVSLLNGQYCQVIVQK